MTSITSVQNSKIKELLHLQKSRNFRRKKGIFVLEGAREIERGAASSFVLQELYAEKASLSKKAQAIISKWSTKIPVNQISKEVFKKLAVREDSDGLIAVFSQQTFTLESLKLKANPLLVIAENLEKPGNLGALLRSADGAGVDAFILTGKSVDPYNPNSLRASLGASFTIPIVDAKNAEEIVAFCQRKKIRMLAASPEAKLSFHKQDFSKPTAIVLGSEADGLTKFWFDHADELVRIPMNGVVDSLNVSVAGAIMMYEALRQRSG